MYPYLGRDVIIRQNPVAALLQALGAGVIDDILGLGGKADNQAQALGARLDKRASISGFWLNSSTGAASPSFFNF